MGMRVYRKKWWFIDEFHLNKFFVDLCASVCMNAYSYHIPYRNFFHRGFGIENGFYLLTVRKQRV